MKNIKKLYEKINHKNRLIKMVAKDLGLSAAYVRNHWFSNFWIIPEKHQARVIELMQRAIAAGQ